jgi:hypothetical protein
MLINYDEAWAYQKSITDEQKRDFLYHAATEIWLLMDSPEDGLKGDFDMLFFFKVLANVTSLPYVKVTVERGDDDDVIFGW